MVLRPMRLLLLPLQMLLRSDEALSQTNVTFYLVQVLSGSLADEAVSEAQKASSQADKP
jgi:hypothetical protein